MYIYITTRFAMKTKIQCTTANDTIRIMMTNNCYEYV